MDSTQIDHSMQPLEPGPNGGHVWVCTCKSRSQIAYPTEQAARDAHYDHKRSYL